MVLNYLGIYLDFTPLKDLMKVVTGRSDSVTLRRVLTGLTFYRCNPIYSVDQVLIWKKCAKTPTFSWNTEKNYSNFYKLVLIMNFKRD